MARPWSLHGGKRHDWVVLHGGPTAVFRVGSLAAATALANAIVRLPEVNDAELVMTMTPRQLSVRLSRDVLLLQDDQIQLARAISAAARASGVEADRAVVQEVQLAVAAKPGAVAVDFWRAVLGYIPMSDDNGVDPLGHGSTVWMQELDEQKPLQHAMHVDVSLAQEQAESRVQAALAAGGRIVQDTESPGLWILADPAGNRVCIASWPDGAPTASADGQ